MLLTILRGATAILAAALVLVGSQVPEQRVVRARVSLISAMPGFPADGAEATVGLRFAIDDGWRVSWENPGGTGAAPVAAWDVPKTVEMGAIEWPAPSRFVTGDAVSYGYERSVIFPLTARLRSGAPVERGVPVTIRGTVSYSVCRDECVNETATVTLSLPAGADPGARTADADAIDAARAKMPKPMPSRWLPHATLVNGELRLDVTTGAMESAAAFFPSRRGEIDDAALPSLEPAPKGLVLHLRAGDLAGSMTVLDGVIVLPKRGAFALACPIRR